MKTIFWFCCFISILPYSVFSETINKFGCLELSKGKIQTPLGYEIYRLEPKKDFDEYEFRPSEDNPYGGIIQKWKVYKDGVGRVSKIESNETRPSHKTIQFELKKRELKKANDFSKEVNDIDTFLNFEIKSTDKYYFKYGAIIELKYSNGSCGIQKIQDKFYNTKFENYFAQTIFDHEECIRIFNPTIKKDQKADRINRNITESTSYRNSFSISEYLSTSVMGYNEKILYRKEDNCHMFSVK